MHNILVQTLRRVLVLLRAILIHVEVVVVQVVLLRTAVGLQIVHRVVVMVAVVVYVQRHQLRRGTLREQMVCVHQKVNVLATSTRVFAVPVIVNFSYYRTLYILSKLRFATHQFKWLRCSAARNGLLWHRRLDKYSPTTRPTTKLAIDVRTTELAIV